MAESVEWVWQHYIFVEKCLECKCNFWNNRYSSSSSEETLTKLKEHSFNKHNITKYSEHNVEYDENDEKMVPVRGFIRKHFLKLNKGVAECIHCSDKINYNTTKYYYKLYYHLKDKHNDKLTEIPKKEKLYPWYWDHFTIKGECAICNSCNVKYGIKEVAQIIKHLKSYKKPGPSSSSHTNNTNSNTDMGTHAKETNKCQENAHSPPMVEREAGDESVLQHYTPILICKKCDCSYSLNNEASLSLSKDILTKLEKHLFNKHNINYDFVQDDINKKKIPVRRYIRKHFSTLKEDMAKCNICFEVINYQLEAYMLRKRVKYSNLRLKEHLKYNLLHEHLKHSHEDKLTEIQKKEQKVSWHWDYFTTIKNNFQYAICTICERKLLVYNLKAHLKNAHKMTGPSSSSDTDNTDNDTDMGQPTIEANREKNTNSPQNRTAVMAEQETKDNKWVLQYYNPTLTCHKCNVCFSSDNNNILSSKETLTKLKDHLLHEHKLKYDSMIHHNIQHNVNKEQIPVRDFIRKHYTKLRGDTAKCNYCFEVISYTYMNYSSLHDHLKCKHDKLTEVEKKDINFPWYWDYFTPIDTSGEAKSAKCNICISPCDTLLSTSLTEHLKTHKITSPSSSRDTGDTNIATDMGTSTKEAKRQGDSKALSNNMYKMTLATSAGTSEETSSHNEPSSSSSYGYDMDFSAQHQSQESFGAPIPLSEQIRELDTVNENVPSTSESTVSFDLSDFDSLGLRTLFSLQEELYQT